MSTDTDRTTDAGVQDPNSCRALDRDDEQLTALLSAEHDPNHKLAGAMHLTKGYSGSRLNRPFSAGFESRRIHYVLACGPREML